MLFSRKFHTLISIVAVATTLIFLPVSIGLPLHRLLQGVAVNWFPSWLLAPSMLVLSLLGLQPWMVCLLLAAGMLAGVAAWRWTKRRWMQWLLAAGLLAMALFPFLYRYQPAVVAAPGHDLLPVTAPRSFCQHVQRQAQAWWELQPCEYELIGWDEEETLFYNERCGDAHVKLWAYNPDRRLPSQPAAAAPETLYPLVTEPAAIDYVRADVYPPSAEASVRRLSFPRPWIISPTGRWVAAVARHVYGPEDVIIVSTE